MQDRLALHTWTLDTTPLAEVLRIAPRAGWNAVELRHADFAREILDLAGDPHCGLLLDAYHLERSGNGGRGFEDVPAGDIFAFQYSDVPPGPAPGGLRPTDRLPPGEGIVRWRDVFVLLLEKNYAGFLSYEAPNPLAWSRPPDDVAREAADATRALLREVSQAWKRRPN